MNVIRQHQFDRMYDGLAQALAEVRQKLHDAEDLVRSLRAEESAVEAEMLSLGDIQHRLAPPAEPVENVVPISADFDRDGAPVDWSRLPRSEAVHKVLVASATPLTRHAIRDRLAEHRRADHPADISAALSYLRRNGRALLVTGNRWRATPKPREASASS